MLALVELLGRDKYYLIKRDSLRKKAPIEGNKPPDPLRFAVKQ
jgi:hypothetical protein